MADRHLVSIGIDRDNLTQSDRYYLSILRNRRSPVSLHDLATQVGLDDQSVRSDVEPYLIRLGLSLFIMAVFMETTNPPSQTMQP